jgi:hypothetical protein
MPTVNEVLGGVLQNAIDNPQSTIQSILSSVFAITLLLMGVGTLSPKVASIVVTLNTLAKVGLGMYQKDPKKLQTSNAVMTGPVPSSHVPPSTAPLALAITPVPAQSPAVILSQNDSIQSKLAGG